MAEKMLKTKIKLRRDIEANYSSDITPLYGEVLFVDTSDGRLRFKVGDGTSTFGQLPYIDKWVDDKFNIVIIRGYYLNGKFYEDSSYTAGKELPKKELPEYESSLYIDINSGVIYHYTNGAFVSVTETLPTATDEIAGIMKLYKTTGDNEDGTMTQKATTIALNTKVGASVEGEVAIFA